MKLTSKFLILACLLSGWLSAQAEKPFYDSKSWIVNIAGESSFLNQLGFESKLNRVDISAIDSYESDFRGMQKIDKKSCTALAYKMTAAGIGNRFIHTLTSYGGSDIYLRQMALRNANIQDREFASEHIRGVNNQEIETLIADDYEPILRHNYIIFTKQASVKSLLGKEKDKVKIDYAIFKVEVSKEEAFDISMSLGTGQHPDAKYEVKFLCCGRYNSDKPWKARTHISKNAPGLAVRGVLLQRNPARISIGENVGLKKGDLVSFYSQRVNKKGEEYSKRISRARVCGVWEKEAQVNFEAGTAGNRKNGDIVVITPDKLSRWGLAASYTPHIFGGEVRFDRKIGFARSGIIHHLASEFGGAVTDHPTSKYAVLDNSHSQYAYNAPFFLNAGIGYGISKTFIGFLDVMPFFYGQYEAGVMSDFKGFAEDMGKVDTGQDAKINLKSIIWGSSVRFPIGIRVSCNLCYPVRLFVEGGYAFRFGLGKDYKIVKSTCDIIGAKRDGFFVNLGLMF